MYVMKFAVIYFIDLPLDFTFQVVHAGLDGHQSFNENVKYLLVLNRKKVLYLYLLGNSYYT